MSNLASLTAQRDGLLKKIREIEAVCEKNGAERILEAIKNQRWYFFKNKQKVFMDRNTGILWANLDYYPYDVEYSNDKAMKEAIMKFAENNDTGFKKWRLPEFDEFCYIMDDKKFPFMKCTKIDVVRGGLFSRVDSMIYWWVLHRKELGVYYEFKFI